MMESISHNYSDAENSHQRNATPHHNGNDLSPKIEKGTTSVEWTDRDDYRSPRGDGILRTSIQDDYEDGYHPSRPQLQPQPPPVSSFCSFCRWCCTFQHFCYVIQFVNCGLVICLIYLAYTQYPKIEALEAQVREDQDQIAALTEEVREKQEGQIQSLHKAVEQEQKFNFLSLAGFFTLLTCLISMFHMTTHIHKFTQPTIQRKIIAILWMSPIYSVTSFLSLIFPSLEGWMAIIKDFYESYCIYVFLSFLIAVLGEGSRDKAVEVLAKHAGHLDRPTRCLGCFYGDPPNSSDLAKANAVMTECQIYCMQFTLVRPLTTIFSVFVLRRGNTNAEDADGFNEDDEFNDDTYDFNDNSEANIENNFHEKKNSTDSQADELSPTDKDIEVEPLAAPSNTKFENDPNTTDDGNGSDGQTRTLGVVQKQRLKLKRKLQQDHTGVEHGNTLESTSNPNIETSENDHDLFDPFAPSVAPVGEAYNQFPTFEGDQNWEPTVLTEGMPIDGTTLMPSVALSAIYPLAPSVLTLPETNYNGTSNLDYNTTDLGGVFDGNTIPTMSPTLLVGSNDTSFDTTVIVDQTKAYFKSPGFAVAMVVNVSIFFAFSGLLKLYHAVRQELLWCRPFPKFLTIKAVVFLTFWQGLAILLWLVLTSGPDEKDSVFEVAHKYQNLLICVEMLLVAISQWCVFPAIEWEHDYVPRQMHTPGIGFSDFVTDVGEIVKNRSGRSRKGRKIARRKKRGGSGSTKNWSYHIPGMSSFASSQDDVFVDSRGDAPVETFHDDFESSDYDSCHTNEENTVRMNDETELHSRKKSLEDIGVAVTNVNALSENPTSPSGTRSNRIQLESDGTGHGPDEDFTDDHLEML